MPWYAVIVKARRKQVQDAYVVMDLQQYVALLADLEDLIRDSERAEFA